MKAGRRAPPPLPPAVSVPISALTRRRRWAGGRDRPVSMENTIKPGAPATPPPGEEGGVIFGAGFGGRGRRDGARGDAIIAGGRRVPGANKHR